MDLVARVDYQHVGETHFHTLQGEQTPTIWNAFFAPGFNADFSKSSRDAYSTVDMRVGLEAENWSLTGLGSKHYRREIPAGSDSSAGVWRYFNHPSALRGYGIDVTYRF